MGLTDGYIDAERSAVIEFARFLGQPVWAASGKDADRYLTWLRRDRGLSRSTVESRAGALARFFEFMIARYQGDIHALTGVVVVQPVDEFNRPASTWTRGVRVPPSDQEVEHLFTAWADALVDQRKYLTAARDYVAASLWRRVGLRLNETVMLDLRDWRPDLGEHGKLHVRFGKGSHGRGPKTRLVPSRQHPPAHQKRRPAPRAPPPTGAARNAAPAPSSSTPPGTSNPPCSTCPPARRWPRPAGCSTPNACPTRPTRGWRPTSRSSSSTTPAATAGPRRRFSAAQQSLRVLQLLQDSPGAPLLASDAVRLRTIGLTATPVIDVATAAGVMLDDRDPSIDAWFETTIADLPAGIQAELRAWFGVMINGSTTAPRRHPRGHDVIRHYLRNAMPALSTWARQGHTTLRDITSADVRAVLPASGTPRSTMGAGLRAILTVLKARKIIFVNPIARIRTGGHEHRDPLPARHEEIRKALLSPDPACAALVALATFHGLRNGEIRNLHLTDLADGRLRLGTRTILLAEPAQVRLSAWLDHRNRLWPNSANPYLFINKGNAGRTVQVGPRWFKLAIGISIKTLREDRILDEALNTGGDVRRISDLFGLSVGGALRYLPNPDLDDTTSPKSTPSS